ncbi:uncharacterized protein LOC5516107 isoform X1 [Nematostella vectensis]|uniref:uncharacterized protein LOC5516107 isoform X1 n=3 Tax=Nematostella vectensis TaxID=45351 RepID=UPI0020774052|nr:uncharacterized protein LOC5516107 isoform X1 [Nematostella vectensis]
MDEFTFSVGDVVLAEWEDKLFYAKIQSIDPISSYCKLIFDDNSVEECPFAKIHSVTETTAEIVCIICKDGNSASPNEIVLCDKCGIGYHQLCHDPSIPAKAVEPDEPWMCRYCSVGAFCPYLQNPFEAKDKKQPLRRRRIHTIRKEGSLSSGNSTEDEDRKGLPREMSSYFYSLPSQHRDGHRSRGRPPLSHNRHPSDKKTARESSRGTVRTPARTRDQHVDRENDMELSSRKTHGRHGERTESRFHSPGRSKSSDDLAEPAKDRSRETTPTMDQKGEDSSKKNYRRELPREKQRLTQDLAKQKRLLSEDLARAQTLQRAPVKSETGDSEDSPRSPASDCSTGRDLSMYEKCYGGLSPDSQSSAAIPEKVEKATDKNKCDTVGESLFERVLQRSTQENKKIEFVSDDSLGMCGGGGSHSNHILTDSSHGNVTRTDKVALPVVENVTDDELPVDARSVELTVNGVASPDNVRDACGEMDKNSTQNVDKLPGDGSVNNCACADQPEGYLVNGIDDKTKSPKSDHSIKSDIKILDNDEVQCEHSHKYGNAHESDDHACAESNCKDDHSEKEAEDMDNNEGKSSTLYGQESDSNNEGMSDAEELSDSELASSGRSKVKRKKKKKCKSKSPTKADSPQRPLRRSKSSKRIGRPPKTNKKSQPLDSDSEENVEQLEEEENAENLDSVNINEDVAGDSKRKEEERGEGGEEFSPEEGTEGRDDGSPSHQDSDTEDNSQDIFSLTESERLELEEQGRRERARKEKRIAARHKRKSEEKDRDKERATPPHLISQNRFARDLPRHNWLVERLLQQKKLGQEALKPGSDENPDNEEEEEGEEEGVKEEEKGEAEVAEEEAVPVGVAPPNKVKPVDDQEPGSPHKDEFQSELHKSFLRRSFPSKVPRTPPKLKPSSPDNNTGDKPVPPPLKHKLQHKELSALEPVPKLKKIVTESEKPEETPAEKQSERPESPKEGENNKSQSPIEILDDEEDKRNKFGASESQDGIKTERSESREDSVSPEKRSTFSPAKKGIAFSPPKKVAHSVSPTLPGSGSECGSHVTPHHRAAILIPVVPMHDVNGVPIPPSMGPSSPHLNGRSPRTFTPQLITHNVPFSSSGMFGSPLPPSRYTAGSCMHHMLPGHKASPCKRDVNCPFHGASPRGMPPSGILGLPSHHGMIPSYGQHGHDFSQILGREQRECDKPHCTSADCKLRHDKGSPKPRDNEQGGSDKMATPKVVKPIAHVPGRRPPLMLSHLQQIGGRPPHGFGDIDPLMEEKARRGIEPLTSPHAMNKSPERSPREGADRRGLPMTLSDLNRRREQGVPSEGPIPGLKRPDFLLPSFGSPPGGLSKPGLLHPKDAVMFSTIRGQPCVVSQADKRDAIRRMEEREHAAYMENLLKSGPPRLRPLEEHARELGALRNYSDQKKREEMAMRESFLAREQNAMLYRRFGKEHAGIPPAKLFDERSVPPASRESFINSLARTKEADFRLLGAHGNSSIMSGRSMEERKTSVEEEKGGLDADSTRRSSSADTERREREMREDQAMKELDRRRNIELMHEKEQEKRMNAEREAIRNQVMVRERMKELHGAEAEKHFNLFRHPRDTSPPQFLRRDFYSDRLMVGDLMRPDHRLDLRAAALQDLQRRHEAMRAGEASHRELLGRMASSHKPGPPGDRPVHPDVSRSLGDVRSHSPLTASRSFPLSMASRQAMDRLAAAAAGKSTSLLKEPEKDVSPHIRAEMERERDRERHRLSLEQIDANRRLLHAELKDKVNPLVLNRDLGPRDREKEIAALRARERLMTMERMNEERKRKLDEPEGIPGRRMSSPQFGHPLDRAEYERAKRLKTGVEPPTGMPRVLPAGHPLEGKPKDDRGRSIELDLGKPPGAVMDREIWMRERERALRAREELSRMKVGLPPHVQGFGTPKDRPDGPPREGVARPKGEEDGVNLCSVCKRDASFLCSGCQGAWYCSAECQLSAWSKHSRDCGQSQRQ